MTAEIVVPTGVAEGVIVTQGGAVGGWALYVKSGKLKYCYNFFGIEHFFAEFDQPIPTGKHQVRMEFKYDGGGIAKGGDVTLYCDGNAVGKRQDRQDHPDGLFGRRSLRRRPRRGSPSSPDYGPTENAFNGEIAWVRLRVGDDDHNHLISPEDRLTLPMAKQ